MRWKMGTPVAVTQASVAAASAEEHRVSVWRVGHRRGLQRLTGPRCGIVILLKYAVERIAGQRQAGAA